MIRIRDPINKIHVVMLENKSAITYGAGGSLGGAVAKALAGSGARLFHVNKLIVKTASNGFSMFSRSCNFVF